MEVDALANIRDMDVKKFLWKNIVTRFGVPNFLISDNGLQFDSRAFREFCSDLGIKNKYSTPVYPQSNGQAKAVNKIIVNGLKKRLDGAKGKWGRRFAQRFMGIPNNAQEIYKRNAVFLDVWGRSCDTGRSKPMQS